MARAPMTNTELGIAYERYVGHLYERKGWSVVYRGILKGMRDKGRDLVCFKESVVHIVQCKCWAATRQIGPDVVTRLIETTSQYRQRSHDAAQSFLNFSGIRNAVVKPALVTSTKLDATARAAAEAGGVSVRENIPLEPFPAIKCCHDRSVYYLPAQADYDKVMVRVARGDGWVSDEATALGLGYRKADSLELPECFLQNDPGPETPALFAAPRVSTLAKGSTRVDFNPPRTRMATSSQTEATPCLHEPAAEYNAALTRAEIDDDLRCLADLVVLHRSGM